MTEINGSTGGFNYSIQPAGLRKSKTANCKIEAPLTAAGQTSGIDTGYLGRSQVHGLRGINIPLTIDEAVSIASQTPVRLKCSEMIFENMYNQYTAQGLSEEAAYAKALLDEEEFLDLSSAIKR